MFIHADRLLNSAVQSTGNRPISKAPRRAAGSHGRRVISRFAQGSLHRIGDFWAADGI